MALKTYGQNYIKALEYAKQHYTWLRELMRPYRDNIDERWFFSC